jgi:hypothetical protein
MDPYSIEFKNRPSKKHERLHPISATPLAKRIRQAIIQDAASDSITGKAFLREYAQQEWIIQQNLVEKFQSSSYLIGRALKELVAEGLIQGPINIPTNQEILVNKYVWKWNGQWQKQSIWLRTEQAKHKIKRVPVTRWRMDRLTGVKRRVKKSDEYHDHFDGRGYRILINSEAFKKAVQENGFMIQSDRIREQEVDYPICKRCHHKICPGDTESSNRKRRRGRKHPRSLCNANIVTGIMKS